MARGECLAYGSLQADSKVKFAAWPIRVDLLFIIHANCTIY